MKKITVIGGGGTGIMMAADLSMRGFEVTLFELERHAKNFSAIRERGYVEITGNAACGKAVIGRLTTDIKEALEGASVILIAVMAQRQEEIIKAMAPHLADGQLVCFSAGNCASILLRRELTKAWEGKPPKVGTGEMQGNIYPCRLLPDGRVVSAFPYKEKPVAAFPARDNETFVDALGEVYPCHGVKNVFQAALNSPNVSIHLAGTILGVAKMETTQDFRLYRDGLSPSVERLIDALENEKQGVMDRMGYDMIRAVGQIRALREYGEHPELDIFRSLVGPVGINHRYITEDAYTGNSLLLSLAIEYGIRTPVLSGLIAIASALNQTDFYGHGRTLESFGLRGLNSEAVNQYLETGEI